MTTKREIVASSKELEGLARKLDDQLFIRIKRINENPAVSRFDAGQNPLLIGYHASSSMIAGSYKMVRLLINGSGNATPSSRGSYIVDYAKRAESIIDELAECMQTHPNSADSGTILVTKSLAAPVELTELVDKKRGFKDNVEEYCARNYSA